MATNNGTNTGNSNNLFSDMSNSDILFINILNTMYNDNLRIIHHLMDQNTEITSQLIDIMNSRRIQNNSSLNNASRGINHRNYNREHYSRRYRNNPIVENVNNNNNSNNSNNNNNNTQRRVYIDNIPYYVDDLQLYTIPLNSSTSRNVSSQFSRMVNSFLEPINVTPTQTQIENATRNIVYGDILDPINNSCPISLEPFTDTSHVTMIRHCRHIFNTNSLLSWFNSNCKCPVCRYDIRNHNPNNNNNNNNTATTSDQEREDEEEEKNANEYVNRANNQPTNADNLNNNAIETLFVEILSDLSNNNIEYTLDNTSQLFNSLFSMNRRRESRR
jgi:hypothetical protein